MQSSQLQWVSILQVTQRRAVMKTGRRVVAALIGFLAHANFNDVQQKVEATSLSRALVAQRSMRDGKLKRWNSMQKLLCNVGTRKVHYELHLACMQY